MCFNNNQLPLKTMSFAQNAAWYTGKNHNSNQSTQSTASLVLQASLCGSDNARVQKVRDRNLQRAHQAVSAEVVRSALFLKSPSKVASGARGV